MTGSIAIRSFRLQDRRQKMPFFCLYHLGIKAGRRIGERRLTESGKPGYVDRYAGHLLWCVIAILFLNVLDVHFTLSILASGGQELNWFMAVLIEDSIGKFVAVKFALTSMALTLLVIHHNVQLLKGVRVRHIKYLILAGYTALVGYELYLLDLAAASVN